MDPPTHPVLQQIHRIDKSSPSFSDQLNNAIHGPEYLRCVPILGDDDAAWLVNYLDEVRRRVPLPTHHSSHHRLSMILIPQILHSGGVYTNLEAYVALGRFFRHPTSSHPNS